MKGLNKIMLIGRLGKDPETRVTGGSQPFSKFSLATDESWNDRNGERQTRTEWHNIVAWGKLSDICQRYLHKGSLVYVEGRIQTRSWDGQDGQKKYITEVVMSDMTLLDPKKSFGGEGAAGDSFPTQGDAPHREEYPMSTDGPILDDDVPF